MAIDLITLQKKVLQLRIDGQYKKTVEACSELLERGRKEKDDKSIFTALINKAAAYYNIGEIEESFLCIDQHLEYCVDHGDEADWLNGYNILFLLHEHNKDYVKAKETLHQAIRLGLSLHKFNIVSNAYSNFSSILASEESFKEALKYAEKGLEMAKRHEPNTPILEFRVKLNIANALIGLNLMEEASSLVEALRMDTLLTTHIREKTQVHDLYSRFLIKEKRFTEAYDALTIAKELAESYQDKKILKDILEKRCEVCVMMDDIQLGFKAQQDYISILIDLEQQQSSMKALHLGVKYDFAALKRRANRDYLTDLYNHCYIENATNKLLKEAFVTGDNITCIAFDLDNLKNINDTYGHMFGDYVIKLIAKVCKKQIRKDDLIGRFGGDEFAIIFKNLTIEQTKMKAEQIISEVRKLKVQKNDLLIPVTISVGVSDNRGGKSTTFADLFHEADMALYKAKREGKNRLEMMQ